MSVTISAQAMDAALRQRLAPTRLEVIDESYQHAGHAGANDSGVGTHFRVRIAGPAFDGKTAWHATALCMMHCKTSLTRVFMPSPLKYFENALF